MLVHRKEKDLNSYIVTYKQETMVVNNSEGSESSFNEALLKMERIHKLQDYLNYLRINLLSKNLESGQYHYECFIFCLVSLLNEVKDKGSATEKKEAVVWRDSILDLLEVRPAFVSMKRNGVDGQKTNKEFNKDNWKILKTRVFQFEDFVRNLVEKYGFSTPNVESEAGWD